MSDTPRTDKAVRESNGQWSFELRMLCIELETELVAKTEQLDRLNESLAKNKRLFSDKLAEQVIADQVKRIKQLEDELIAAKCECQNANAAV